MACSSLQSLLSRRGSLWQWSKARRCSCRRSRRPVVARPVEECEGVVGRNPDILSSSKAPKCRVHTCGLGEGGGMGSPGSDSLDLIAIPMLLHLQCSQEARLQHEGTIRPLAASLHIIFTIAVTVAIAIAVFHLHLLFNHLVCYYT